MGLQATTASWPNYRWTDGFTPGPDGFAGAYLNWGVGSSGAKQPDNKTHLCGTADYLLARNFTGNLTTLWGWNDVSCTTSHASICWQPPGEQAGLPPAVRRRAGCIIPTHLQLAFHTRLQHMPIPRRCRAGACSNPESSKAGPGRVGKAALAPPARSAQHLAVHQQHHPGHLLLEHHQEQLHRRRAVLQGQGRPAGGVAVCCRAGAARRQQALLLLLLCGDIASLCFPLSL
jgi:hypothetical protein